MFYFCLQKLISELQKLFMSKNETYVLKLWPLFVKLLGKVSVTDKELVDIFIIWIYQNFYFLRVTIRLLWTSPLTTIAQAQDTTVPSLCVGVHAHVCTMHITCTCMWRPTQLQVVLIKCHLPFFKKNNCLLYLFVWMICEKSPIKTHQDSLGVVHTFTMSSQWIQGSRSTSLSAGGKGICYYPPSLCLWGRLLSSNGITSLCHHVQP